MFYSLYNDNFFLNFLPSFIFLLITSIFSFNLLLYLKNNNVVVFQNFLILIIFFLIFSFYSILINIIILLDLNEYFNEIFSLIFIFKLTFIAYNFTFLKLSNFKNSFNFNKLSIVLICIIFTLFLISILPITDADSISYHQNVASTIYLEGLSNINIQRDLEFSIFSNTEILLVLSAFLKSDNFGSQLNLLTLFIFVLFFLKKNKYFSFILLSCPLIIFFISTQKLQLFFGLLYLLLFVINYEKIIKKKIEIFIFVFLLTFYSSGKLSYILICFPLYFYFIYINFNKFKLIVQYSFISFLIIYFPLFFIKQIYFQNILAPFFDQYLGGDREYFKALTLSLKSSEGWLMNATDIKLYLKPFFPTSISDLTSSLGLIFLLMLTNLKLQKKLRYLPVAIIIIIFMTGQLLPRYYFEAFLVLAYYYQDKGFVSKFLIFTQLISIFILSFSYIYISYYNENIIFNSKSYKNRFSYSYFNSISYENLKIKENLIDLTQDRSSLFFSKNVFSNRTIKTLNLYNNNNKNLINFINDNSIKYLIVDNLEELPKCLIVKKNGEIYTKKSIRNFLINFPLERKEIYSIESNNC